MEYIKLNENTRFSRIIQGFWRLTEWNMTTEELIAFMEGCLEKGVTTFDTAEVYGDTECEKQLGQAFARRPDLREKIQLVSKTGIYKTQINGKTFGYYNTTYDRLMQSCKEALQRLHCDYLDLYLIHREDPCIDHYEAARALKDMKKQGLIKEAGVSNFDPFKFQALNEAMDGTLITNQIEWNPACFEHFNSGMMDLLVEKRIHPMIWSPLAGGRLFTSEEPVYVNARKKIEEIAERHNTAPETIVYAWIMYHPVGAMPLSGSNKLFRLEHAVKALDVKLEHYEWYEIYAASGQQAIR